MQASRTITMFIAGGTMRIYSRLIEILDRILVDGFPVIVALGWTVILMVLIGNALG